MIIRDGKKPDFLLCSAPDGVVNSAGLIESWRSITRPPSRRAALGLSLRTFKRYAELVTNKNTANGNLHADE